MTVELDTESYAYPAGLLKTCRSALVLFCSGRMGAADSHWIRAAGLHAVTCVDHDWATLEPFMNEYPEDWAYLHLDVPEYVAGHFGQWDLVSADPPSQLAPEILGWLPAWGVLADRYLVATVYRHCFVHDPLSREGREELPAINGMVNTDLIHRTGFRGGVYWAVYQRV